MVSTFKTERKVLENVYVFLVYRKIQGYKGKPNNRFKR